MCELLDKKFTQLVFIKYVTFSKFVALEFQWELDGIAYQHLAHSALKKKNAIAVSKLTLSKHRLLREDLKGNYFYLLCTDTLLFKGKKKYFIILIIVL